MNPFDHLIPIKPDLLYRRDDPNDRRLGEIVSVDPNQYRAADIVILGCPQDEGVRRNQGRLGAAKAPDEIRRALYRLVAPDPLHITVLDIGDTPIQTTLEATHDRHTSIVQQVVQDGKQIISLGGGNDVAYADCAGLAKAVASVLAINVDAHFDVRADEISNSGTPYRQLLEEGYVMGPNLYEVGNVPMVNSPIYHDYLVAKKANIIDLDRVQARGLPAIFQTILENDAPFIFWGLDMDVVRASDAPGVSAPNPIGLSGYDFHQLGTIAGHDPRSRIFEITEVNPDYDLDGRTARLAAATIYQFITTINAKRG